MASAEIERPIIVEIPAPECPIEPKSPDRKEEKAKTEKTTPEKRRPTMNPNQTQQANQHKRFRHDNDGRHFKFNRKRSYSFNNGGNGKFGPPHKRWKRDFIVPPTKFLLGGNICDPLNLNSMQDEEINRAMNAVTPQSSPLPTPRHRKEAIEVLIPPNIHDPLNLSAPDDDPNYELRLISPKKKKPRNRRRKSATAAAAEEAKPSEVEKAAGTEAEAETSKKPEESTPCDKKPARRSGEGRNNDRKQWPLRRSLDDKIVSPVIPQPGGWKHPPPIFNRNLSWEHNTGPRNRKNHRRNRNRGKSESQEPPVFKPGNARFQYGNYNRYYGYRNPNQEVDARMKCFRKDMFQGKEVLDIGCNVGHVTLSVARQYGARKVTGIDIDRKLVNAAKKNIRHYASCRPSDCLERFPACMPLLYGDLDPPDVNGSQALKFPHNVSFIHGNYVLDSEVLLGMEKPQFDVILCLSVTKWLHLNFGDEGLKRAFRRMHTQLRPGGRLILEPQPWSSYSSKKKLTETIYNNYKSIQFFPQKFTEYLLSAEVGFSRCEVIGTPLHHSRGFQRPIQMFTKAELPHNSPSETVPSTACGDAALPTETSVIRPAAIAHIPEVEEEEWEVEPEFVDDRQEVTPEPEEQVFREAPQEEEGKPGSSKGDEPHPSSPTDSEESALDCKVGSQPPESQGESSSRNDIVHADEVEDEVLDCSEATSAPQNKRLHPKSPVSPNVDSSEDLNSAEPGVSSDEDNEDKRGGKRPRICAD